MVLGRIRQLVDRLSVRAIFNRLDKRKLQNELDTHRLYLVTSHFGRLSTGKHFGEDYVQELAAEAQQLGHEGMKAAVTAAIHKQFVSISLVLQTSLAEASDPMPAALHAVSAHSRQRQQAALAAAPKTQRSRGLAAAMGAADLRSKRAAAARLSETAPRHVSTPSEAGPTPTPAPGSPPPPNPSPSPPSDVSQEHSLLSSSDSESESDEGTPAPRSPNTRASDLHPEFRSSSHAAQSKASVSSSSDNTPPGSSSAALSDSSASAVSTAPAAALSMKQLASALQQQLGYSLTVQPSGIQHPDAGDGLFLQGSAPIGALVALYPGLVYEPMHYRKIPGYPKIDANNDYFLARFDGALIDGQSWGRGRDLLHKQPDMVMGFHNSRHANLAELHRREMRHPLALAHYANHPAAGTPPNVMVAAFDLVLESGEESWLPAYMPNVMYTTAAADSGSGQLGLVKGLAFVAVRHIQDEEILLNYRLNPQVQKPVWYAPVDVEEDKRRWY